jgi:hypothetical protein
MSRFHATPNGLVAFTAEEETLRDAEEAQNAIEQANLATAQQAQATAKASAHAKLSALGLSAEEISALGA